jgi:hypothetical protein
LGSWFNFTTSTTTATSIHSLQFPVFPNIGNRPEYALCMDGDWEGTFINQ